MYDKEVYHFLVLHFPIALFITGFIFNVFYLLYYSSDFSERIKEYFIWTMGMGIIWSILSIITGFVTALELEYMNSFFDLLKFKIVLPPLIINSLNFLFNLSDLVKEIISHLGKHTLISLKSFTSIEYSN